MTTNDSITQNDSMTQADSTTGHWLHRVDRSGYPLLIARLVLGYMFISMGIDKVGDPIAFLKLLREYDLFPDGAFAIENLIALTLPWIEVLCGALLIVGVLVRGAGLTLLLLLTGFTIVIAIRAVGIYNAGAFKSFCDVAFDCGCGGGPKGMCLKIPENIGLWALSWVPLLSASRRFCLAGLLGNRAAPASSGAENTGHITAPDASS